MYDGPLSDTYQGDNPYYIVGFDSFFCEYLMEIDNSQGIKWYYTISKEEYLKGLSDISFMDEIYSRIQSKEADDRFYYSNWIRLNSTELQIERQLMSNYRRMLLGNSREHNLNKMIPEHSTDDTDLMTAGSFTITCHYENDICSTVDIKNNITAKE